VIDQADCMLYEAWNCQAPPTDLSGEQAAATALYGTKPCMCWGLTGPGQASEV